MALTEIQRGICRLVAGQRKEAGVSYVAGEALNLLLKSGRVSRDIDVFHDAEATVHASFAADRRLLELHGYRIETVRELPAFIEAVIRKAGDEVRMEWARDSAFRFFPLMEHEDLGLTLHPFDLASNKVLALVGRLEVQLAFAGSPPDAHALAVTWRTALDQAAAIIDEPPYQQAGTCVLDARAGLFRGDPPALKRALTEDAIRFHEGSLGGAYPRLLS